MGKLRTPFWDCRFTNDGVELFDGNLIEFPGGKKFKKLLKSLDIDLIAVYSGANFIFQEILGKNYEN